jgi:drug/metabolite transporter (DMT)-like permease
MNNRTGILLMLAAMLGFTLEDVFIKQLSSTFSTAQILMTSGVFGSVFFTAVNLRKGHKFLKADVWTKATTARMLGEAIAAVAFVKALSLMPLSTVAAVFQVTPLAITMGAALFLGEQVGWRRWLAIGLGFIGVMLIIKPGVDGFDPSVIWVIIAVLGVVLRDLVTRVIPEHVSSSIISLQAFLAAIVVSSTLLIFTSDSLVAVSAKNSSLFAGAIVFGIAGYYAIVSAMRVGDASIVAPFRYTRLLFSLTTGMIIFGERLDNLSLLGSVIIIGTGLYTFLRERRLGMEKEQLKQNLSN